MKSFPTSDEVAMSKAEANAAMPMIRFLFIYIKHLFLLSLPLSYIQVDYREGLFHSTMMSTESLLREPTDLVYVIMML